MNHHHLHGIDGLHPKRSAYSVQFKQQVLSHQDRERLSARQAAAIYDIRNANQVVVWRRSLGENAAQALASALEQFNEGPRGHQIRIAKAQSG